MSAYLSILSEVSEGLYDCLEVCSSVWSSLRLSGGLYCPTVCCYIMLHGGLSFCLEDLEVCISVRLSRGFSVWLGKKYVRLEVCLSVWRLSVCPPKLMVSRIEDRSRPSPTFDGFTKTFATKFTLEISRTFICVCTAFGYCSICLVMYVHVIVMSFHTSLN